MSELQLLDLHSDTPTEKLLEIQLKFHANQRMIEVLLHEALNSVISTMCASYSVAELNRLLIEYKALKIEFALHCQRADIKKQWLSEELKKEDEQTEPEAGNPAGSAQ